MGNKRENIDQLFKEKFQNFEAATPHDAWQDVSTRLDQAKGRKRILILRWSAIAAALILAFFSGWHFDQVVSSDKNEPSLILSPSTGISSEEFEKPKDVPSGSEASSAHSSDVVKSLNAKTEEAVSEKIDVAPSTKATSPEEIVAPAVTRKHQKSRKLKAPSNASQNGYAVNSEEETTLPVPLDLLPKPTPSITLETLDNNNTLLLSEDDNSKQNYTPSYAVVDPNRFPKRKMESSRFELGLMGGPTVPFRNVRYDKADNAISNNVQNERLENAYAAGITLAYKAENRFEYTAGIMVNNWNQTSNNIILEADEPNNSITSQPDELVGNTSYGSIKFDTPNSFSQVSPSTEAGQFILLPNIQQQYQFVEIPVGVAYYLLDGRFQIKAQMGLNARILSSSTVKLEYPNGDIEDYDGLDPNTWSLQLNAGPNLGYAITNRLRLHVSPTIFYGLTPNTDMDGVETYHHQFLLFSGFSFRL
jgi:hypothetical protein